MKVSGSFEIRPRGGDLDGGTPSSRRTPDNHRGGDDALFDEFNDTLARLEGAGRDRGSTSGLITQIEQLAAVVERQAQELRVARAAAAKLEGENERMRQMLRALIAAIDAGETRLFGTVERAERRLRELIETGTAHPGPSQVQAPRPRATRAVREQEPGLPPKPSIRVIE
jgi:ABC-type transporter Mla subunit MlaD